MSNHPNRTPSRNVRLTRRELETLWELLTGRTGMSPRHLQTVTTKISEALREIENAKR